MFKENEGVGIAYIYCNYKEKASQTLENLVGSLVHQLVRQQSKISDNVVSMYHRHELGNTRLTLGEYSRVLQSECGTFEKVFVVIDALDECPEDGGIRDGLLSELQKLPHNLRLLITSRPMANFCAGFNDTATLDVRASNTDITKYLDHQIALEGRLKIHVRADPTLKDAIIETIINKVDGMSVPQYLTVSDSFC
jgi:hypothetical protein